MKPKPKTITVAITAGDRSCRDAAGVLCKLCVDMIPFAYNPDYECMAYENGRKSVVLKEGKDGNPMRCVKCLKAEIHP